MVKRLSRENPLWGGAPRIVDELALLGHEVGETTVAKYMVRHTGPKRGQSWSTFPANHMDRTIGCDFFTVPTMTFRNLFVFVVLHHASRIILHVNVTEHPTAEWTALQFGESLGDEDAPEVTHLLRDRGSTFGGVFQRKVKALGLADLVTPKASPWCNGFAERLNGTLRRECTDHVSPIGKLHIARVLRELPGDAISRWMGIRLCRADGVRERRG